MARFIRKLIYVAMLFLFNSLVFSSASEAQTLPTIELTTNMDVADVSSYLRYEIGYEDEIDHDSLMEQVGKFQSLKTDNIHFGIPNGKILILLRVKNQSNKSGNWILTTNRGSLKYFKFYELKPGQSTLLIDGSDSVQVKDNLQSYLSFSHEVILSPQEDKVYAIHFEPENIAYLPLEIKTSSSFFKARTVNIALVSSVVGSVFILIFVNVGFFWITGKQEFFWLGLAELALAINALHAEGYTTIYWLYDKPLLSLAFGDIVKCAFVAAISQVIRTFIATRENFPKTDKILVTLIAICFFVCFLEIGVKYYSPEMKSFLHGTSWMLLLGISLYLPFVAFILVQKMGKQYWPLIPAWGALCLFIIYALIATIGIFPSLPFYWGLTGPISLFEAAMMTLALGLHVRKIHKDKTQADKNLTKSLVDKLEISQKAKILADQRATALATIHDQNSIIHAAGHDSRQVVFALNSAIAHLDHTKSDNAELSNMLKASSDYLSDIISVTMSGANMVGDGLKFLCLGLIKTEALSMALEKIYAPIFKKKGLYYKTHNYMPALIISDNAVLMRVLSNIISNSLKFTEQGGVDLTAKIVGPKYVITITDTGRGISESIVAKLNSKDFVRKKENDFFEGSGSGLRFATDMISALGGQIHFQSRKNECTSVVIELPYLDINAPITIEQLSHLKTGLHFTDVDNNEDLPLSSNSACKIAISYDHSSITRARLSEDFDLMLLKPIHTEMVEHPYVKSLLQKL